MKEIGVALAAGGTLGIVAALVWWGSFFHMVAREMGVKDSPPVTCLYSSSDFCGFVYGVARFAGGTPYEPALFWISALALVAGVGILISQRPSEPLKPTE
jgi:hypothetical protein